MASRCRYFCRRLLQIKRYCYPTIQQLPKVTFRRTAVPCTLGFSLFTWLGFNKKLSAEDELILTIKHCVLFVQRGEFQKAEQLLHVALRQAQQMQNELGITYIYDIMANLALEREQLDKAKQLFVAVTQRIMSDGAKEDDPRVIHISAKLARISHLKKEYSTAKLGYEWCLSKLNNLPLETLNDSEKLIALLENWYGRLLVDCDKSNKGLEMMVSSLNRIEKLEEVDKEVVVLQMNDIGTVCDQLERYDEGITYLLQGIEIGKQLQDMTELGALYVNLGRLYMKKKLLEKARKSCGQGWKLGVSAKNDNVRQEAELCFEEIKNLS